MTDASEELARRIARDGVEPLRARLLHTPPDLPLVPRRGDYDLNPGTKPTEARNLKPAAVLLPIVLRAEPTVLFTRRTATLAQHAGQVSFPGGRAEPADLSLVETALRETKEETGIGAEHVTVAGFLDAYETGTGFAILPVVGMLTEGFALLPEPAEVDEVFEIPLAFILDPSSRRLDSREWQGRRREFYVYDYEGHYVWGATAAILSNFSDRMRA
ncbi:MAG TPA: CoA pyrophosphatase [Rhizomicrobium sp.]|jgi:8-oxo-dGTP pyrophosphatase MutT (NUDIX family)